ncbi:hypothetical protein P4133_31345 [Pseudomonas aeruginosa]|nr:hypothetical protein [Pseudomonas aeruginosa]
MAFALCLEATAHDDALEVLEALLRDLFNNAEKADKKARMRSLEDLDRSAATLAAACKVVLDNSISDDNVRPAVQRPAEDHPGKGPGRGQRADPPGR